MQWTGCHGEVRHGGNSTAMQQIANRWVNMTFTGPIFAISITPCRCQHLRSHDRGVVSSTRDEISCQFPLNTMSYWRTFVMHKLD